MDQAFLKWLVAECPDRMDAMDILKDVIMCTEPTKVGSRLCDISKQEPWFRDWIRDLKDDPRYKKIVTSMFEEGYGDSRRLLLEPKVRFAIETFYPEKSAPAIAYLESLLKHARERFEPKPRLADSEED